LSENAHSIRRAAIALTREALVAGIQIENRATTLSTSEEEVSKKVREPEGAASTDEYADESERHPLAHDQVAKIRGLWAERHADAKFRCGLLNRVGHHGLYADRRQEKPGKPKEGQQQHIQSPARDIRRFDFLQKANLRNPEASACLAQGGRDRGCQRAASTWLRKTRASG
jgi:hypothetical protein